ENALVRSLTSSGFSTRRFVVDKGDELYVPDERIEVAAPTAVADKACLCVCERTDTKECRGDSSAYSMNDVVNRESPTEPSGRPIDSRLRQQSKKQISSVTVESFCSRDERAQDEVSMLSSCENGALRGEVRSGELIPLSPPPPNTATKIVLSGCQRNI